MLSEGNCFDSPGLHIEVSLDKTVNPKQLLVSTLYGSHCHQCMNACINYCKSLWTKVSDKCPKMFKKKKKKKERKEKKCRKC